MIQQDLKGNEIKLLMTSSAASKTFPESPGKKKEKGVRALFCSAGQKQTRPEPG
jgi:hypothetical protein